jgi:dephospho-CoA kinase
LEKIGGSVKIKKVAVTGTLSSGKSLVCQIFADRGAYIISADSIVHRLLSSDPSIIRQVVEIFGDSIFTNGQIDRQKLAKIVFPDREKLRRLEAILHPKVIEEIKISYETVKNSPLFRVFVAEVPLLFNIGFQSWFDTVIAVVSDPNKSLKRFMDKGFSSREYELRSKELLSSEEIARRSHTIIINDGSIEDLYANVNQIPL